MTPLELATLFHDTYEALAPVNGYETRPETRAFDPNTPNGKTMIATAAVVLSQIGYSEIADANQRCHDIAADIKDFDGDKRGMYAALEEAGEKLGEVISKHFPDRNA